MNFDRRQQARGNVRAVLWMLIGVAMHGYIAGAAVEPPRLSPLSDLASPHVGKAMHEGSWDRRHDNTDWRALQPGDELTLLDHEGAGIVQRFWMTLAPRQDVGILSQVILRMYWDDDTYPSVECPIGAFFGVGFGEQRDFVSLPLDETSGGYNSYWPMPFHKSARWTLSNGSSRTLDSFYYNIDYVSLPSLPADTRHFHAQFHRENPTSPDRDYTILETSGAGHYVGTALFMSGRGLLFLEGNERVFVDGESTASIEGTGTEDYFSSGWYFDRGTYSAPYHGVVVKDEHPARISAYRWHIEDAIPFSKSIRFTIEHGAGNTQAADYSSVAYYYLAGSSPKPPPLPTDLLPSRAAWHIEHPMVIPGVIEAESLKATAKKTSGYLDAGYMDELDDHDVWSQGQVLWWSLKGDETNGALTLAIPSARATRSQLVFRVVAGPDSGIVQFFSDGVPLDEPIDLWADTLRPREITLRPLRLRRGSNEVVIRAIGKNPRATGVGLGVDSIALTRPR